MLILIFTGSSNNSYPFNALLSVFIWQSLKKIQQLKKITKMLFSRNTLLSIFVLLNSEVSEVNKLLNKLTNSFGKIAATKNLKKLRQSCR